MYLKNHSCPTKPWLLQIQCLSTGVERGVGQLSSVWCLIHGMKSMFSPISVYVIWLDLLGSTVTASTSAKPRHWDVRVPVCLTGKPEAAVNQCYRAMWGWLWWGVLSWLRWSVGTKENGITTDRKVSESRADVRMNRYLSSCYEAGQWICINSMCKHH